MKPVIYLFTLLMILIPLRMVSQVQTVVLQPGPSEGYDSEVRSDMPDQNLGDWFDFIANAWTAQGNFFIMRSFIRFDLTSIPAGSNVINATLDLYTNLNTGHYQLDSGPNTAYFMRLTEDWLEHGVTWNNQPYASFENLVVLPQSTSHTQTYHIDLTGHVQDMVHHPETNFGWMFRLETEDIYRCMVFASSDHPNISWRPRLTVSYSNCTSPIAGFYFTYVYPEVNFFDATIPPDIHTWYWDFGDESHSSEQNPVHIYDYSGTYNVCLYVIDSCSIDSICQEVAFFPPMYHNIQMEPSSLNGLVISFKDKTSGATAWLWDFGDGSSSTLQNPAHTYKNYGKYNICMTGTYGNSDITSCDSLDLKEKIINPVYQTTFYPNPPSNHKITVRFATDAEYSDIKLFDLTGKIIWNESIYPACKQHPVEIDLPDLRSGLYFLRIDLDGKQEVFKLSIP